MIRTAILAAAILAAPALAHADTIEQVNTDINRTVRYVEAPAHPERPNFATGNCLTIALDKMIMLRRWGVKADRMTVYLGRAETGQGHAVLVIDGRRVLDSRIARTVPLSALAGRGYTDLVPLPRLVPMVLADEATRGAR